MLIIGLNGSPNKNGNTKLLINKVLEKAQELGAETKIIEVAEVLSSAKHGFCNVCSNPCNRSCYQGTKLAEAYELMRKADGIVFGSPVYFGTVTGQLKAFIDKSRVMRGEKALYNKVAAGVTVATCRFGGQETTIKALHDMMLVHGMMIVADGHGEDDCGHHGVCAQRPAQDDTFALKRAEVLGKRLVEVCKATESLRNSQG